MLPFTAFKLIDEVSRVNPMEASGARWGKIPRQCCVEICSVIFTACVTRYWHSRQLALGFFLLACLRGAEYIETEYNQTFFPSLAAGSRSDDAYHG